MFVLPTHYLYVTFFPCPYNLCPLTICFIASFIDTLSERQKHLSEKHLCWNKQSCIFFNFCLHMMSFSTRNLSETALRDLPMTVINTEFGKARINPFIKSEMTKFKDRLLIWNKSLVHLLSIIIDMKFSISII